MRTNGLRLHLGCGKRDFGIGWINIDSVKYNHVQYYDVTKLPFEDNSCSLLTLVI